MIRTTSAYAENTSRHATVPGWAWNYLRVRGEYWILSTWTLWIMELPPRTRRIRRSAHAHPIFPGTTSAYAENTSVLMPIFSWNWNYLRVRGEYLACGAGHRWEQELPPRTRRIRGRWGFASIQNGNYLRVRGEYNYTLSARRVNWELPPRTRRIHDAASE